MKERYFSKVKLITEPRGGYQHCVKNMKHFISQQAQGLDVEEIIWHGALVDSAKTFNTLL